MPKVVTLSVGLFEVNCYLIYFEEKKILYIVDPGSDGSNIIEKAKTFDFNRVVILLTHAHVDHISAVGKVAKELNAEYTFLRNEDEQIYRSKENALLPFYPLVKDLVEVKNSYSDDEEFHIIALPGHTPGGCGFYFEKLNAIFVGDTLFANSIGRTDLPGGDYAILEKSIKENIYSLCENLEVFPGHGPSTTVGKEKKTNPFVKG